MCRKLAKDEVELGVLNGVNVVTKTIGIYSWTFIFGFDISP